MVYAPAEVIFIPLVLIHQGIDLDQVYRQLNVETQVGSQVANDSIQFFNSNVEEI